MCKGQQQLLCVDVVNGCPDFVVLTCIFFFFPLLIHLPPVRPAAPSPARALFPPTVASPPPPLLPPRRPPPALPLLGAAPARAASYGDNEDPYPSLSDYHDYEPNLEFDDTELQSASSVTGKMTTTTTAAAATASGSASSRLRRAAGRDDVQAAPYVMHCLPAACPEGSCCLLLPAALALHDSLASAAVCLVAGGLHG